MVIIKIVARKFNAIIAITILLCAFGVPRGTEAFGSFNKRKNHNILKYRVLRHHNLCNIKDNKDTDGNTDTGGTEGDGGGSGGGTENNGGGGSIENGGDNGDIGGGGQGGGSGDIG